MLAHLWERKGSLLLSWGQWRQTSEGRKFLALVGWALLVRLLLSPYHGFFDDLQGYVNWGSWADAHFLHFYSFAVDAKFHQPYPPLAIYLFALLDWAYVAAGQVVGAHPTLQVAQEPQLAVLIKLPTIAADLGMVAVIYALARRVFTPDRALRVAAMYAFLPAILLDGALWGQTDAIVALPIVLALLCTLKHRAVWAGVLFALAVTFKPEPVIFAPLILAYLWRWAGWRTAICTLGSMAVSGVVICLPYLLPPSPELLVYYRHLEAWIKIEPYASHGAFNLWWILAPTYNYSSPWLGPLSPNLLGWMLFLVVLAVVVVGVWRYASPQRLFLGAALLSLAFFVLGTLQHERYLYPALALFLVAGLYRRRNLVFYGIASVTFFFNMLISILYNIALWKTPFFQHYSGVVNTSSLVIAWIHLWLLVLVVAVYLVSLRRMPLGVSKKRRASHLDKQEGTLALVARPRVERAGEQESPESPESLV